MSEPTGDRRTVATDALATLGTIIDDKQKRDAIHLAVEPVIAGEKLRPGEHITVVDGVATGADVGAGLGIVDPFLTKLVKKGERFWFVMYPRMVHSLRHVWTHPAFPDGEAAPVVEEKDTDKATAESWLRNYAVEIDIGFQRLIDAAGDWLEGEDYLVDGGTLDGVVTKPEFWTYYAAFTGKTVPEDKRQNFFSCSC